MNFRQRNLVLLATSVLVACFLSEAVLRLYLWTRFQFERARIEYTYPVTPSVWVEYDREFGERPVPESEGWVCWVKDGRVVWGTVIIRTNRDGLDGLTTLEQYEQASKKILVFGDSFTRWNQGGQTWPDVLNTRLSEELACNVAVLNYARGAYGVLQMLDLAADRAAVLRPDLVILAAIKDDFTRDRWWCDRIEDRGVVRWMLSSKPDEFRDYRYAVDEVLVNANASREWCERMSANGDPTDPVLRETNAQYARLKREVDAVRRGIDLFSTDRSYLLRLLSEGSPYDYPARTIPRVKYDDFAEDPSVEQNLARIRESGARLVLIYLPTDKEIRTRELRATRQARRLMKSLERMAGTPFLLLQDLYTRPVPTRTNLKPYDGHPNDEGLEWYGAVVADLVLGDISCAEP